MKTLVVLLAFVAGAWCLRTLVWEEVSATHLPQVDLVHNTMDAEAADLDGDGDADLVLAIEFKPNIILINDGSGKFTNQSAARLPQPAHDSEDIALADFDGDGDTDIVFVSEDDRVHEYYRNDGKGVFTDQSATIALASTANAVDAADYDRDGDVDLLIGNDGQELFLANNGKGIFTDETMARLPVDYTVTQDVQSADVDADGDLDLLLGNENGNRLYLNDGKGVFVNGTEGRLPLANEETRKLRLHDINGDGHLDVVVCNVDFGKGKDKANRMLVNNGKGVFTDETAQRLRAVNDLHTADAAFVDADGDGDKDLVLGNVFGGYLQVCVNDGKGVYTEATERFFPQRIGGDVITLETGDWNKDGKPDLYLGVFRGADRLFFSR